MTHKGQSILAIITTLACMLLILNGLSSRAQNPLLAQRHSPIDEDQFPIVEESAPEFIESAGQPDFR